MIRLVPLSIVVVFTLAALRIDVRAQGRTIQAQDGDVVLMPADATITIARGIEGHLKIAAHENGRILVIMIDEGPNPDGLVDLFHRFELQPAFPAEYVWEGFGTLEEYEPIGRQRGPSGIGVVTPQGRIFLAGMSAAKAIAGPDRIATFTFTRSSSQRVRGTFGEIEQEAVTGQSRTGIQSRLEVGVMRAPGVESTSPPPDGPVRVGGKVRQPVKIKDVPPVMPEIARQARVQGVVIVEITIDAQGKVANAQILRSIPLLDQAALDAVRQWEFEPVLLNGEPRPVTMTVTVPFTAQSP